MSKRDYSYRNLTFCLLILQQSHLPARWTKGCAIQIETLPPVQPEALDRLAEALRRTRPAEARRRSGGALVALGFRDGGGEAQADDAGAVGIP